MGDNINKKLKVISTWLPLFFHLTRTSEFFLSVCVSCVHVCVWNTQVVMTPCFHSAYVEDFSLLVYDTIVIDIQVPVFQRSLLPPFLEKLHRKNCVLHRWTMGVSGAVEWGVAARGTCRKMEGGGIGFLGAWEMKGFKRKLG